MNAEFVYYHSREDSVGDDPSVPNSQWRLLLGYEAELRSELTFAAQYYLEWTRQHGRLLANSPYPEYAPEQDRHLLTLYLNQRLWQQRLSLSLFSFWSPSDEDFYLRPMVRYRFDDSWQLTAGANLLGGEQRHSMFAQMEKASNLYLRLRYHY